ncbi:MAG: inositol monophosphatase [Desulfobacteraceae bacterium]|nr:inositol monophosphatase [Desulfobacteraceae bacterium]
MNMDNILRTGILAAHQGGEKIRSWFGSIETIGKKGAIDLVTDADTDSEEVIVRLIKERYPDHSILSEETGAIDGNPECRWIIDPLDGTTNFAHGLGIFAVSIAFEFRGRIQVGVVWNPITCELFTAIKGQGAELNGVKIHVSNAENVSDSLLATGFPYTIKNESESIFRRFSNCLRSSRGIRRLGSAALDLCFVGCGRFDGFWEQYLKPWDIAAGLLIATEADGMATDFSNNPVLPDSNEILVTNGKIHQELVSLLDIKDNT